MVSGSKRETKLKQESRLSILSVILPAAAGMMLLALFLFLGVTVNFERQQSRMSDGFFVVSDYKVREIKKEDAPAGVMKEYTITIGKALEKDTCLAFYTVHQYVEIYIDDKLVYSLKPSKDSFIRTIGSNWTMIPLYREDAGKELRIHIIPAYEQFLHREVEFLIGSELSICMNRLYQDFPQFMLSVIAIFVGIVFFGISLYQRLHKLNSEGISDLGLFSVMIGLWRLTDMRFTPFLVPGKPVLLFYISVGMMMMGMIPFVKTVRSQFHKAGRCILDWYCIIAAIVCMVQLLLQVKGITDFRENIYITHYLIGIGAGILVGNVIYERVKYTKNEKDAVSAKAMFIILLGVLTDIVAFYVKGTSSGLLFSLLAILVYIMIKGGHMILRYAKQEKELAEKERILAENERQLIESRISTMISQIRPHFIYNTLGSIEQLCELQPEAAAQLVHNFSCYLRGNFSELDNPSPIHLSQEMKHIKYYVSIEKVRFPDIEIRFHMGAEDFLLPALSVQPLVENAIKHGLMGLSKGGTVTVSSFETDTQYCISVEDDGVGFDTSILLDERTHIGLRNIRCRLESMCNGTLTVESTPGIGTKVLIAIPKEVEE